MSYNAYIETVNEAVQQSRSVLTKYGIRSLAKTSVVAGGAITPALAMGFGQGATGALGIYFGSGAPTISAPQGSMYMNTTGSSVSTRAYINNSAGVGTSWTALTTAA